MSVLLEYISLSWHDAMRLNYSYSIFTIKIIIIIIHEYIHENENCRGITFTGSGGITHYHAFPHANNILFSNYLRPYKSMH